MSSSPALLHKGRLEALCDGVFAVVLTLLVLDLKLDHLPQNAGNDDVWTALREARGSLFGYAFSFLIVAVFWVLQHRKFALLAHTNTRHMVWTFAFLFGISLMPFTSSLYLRSMQSGVACSLYFASFAFIAAMLLGSWLDARRSGLVAAAVDTTTVDRFTRRLIGMALANAVGAVVAYFRPAYAATALVLMVIIVRQFLKPPSPVAKASASPAD